MNWNNIDYHYCLSPSPFLIDRLTSILDPVGHVYKVRILSKVLKSVAVSRLKVWVCLMRCQYRYSSFLEACMLRSINAHTWNLQLLFLRYRTCPWSNSEGEYFHDLHRIVLHCLQKHHRFSPSCRKAHKQQQTLHPLHL